MILSSIFLGWGEPRFGCVWNWRTPGSFLPWLRIRSFKLYSNFIVTWEVLKTRDIILVSWYKFRSKMLSTSREIIWIKNSEYIYIYIHTYCKSYGSSPLITASTIPSPTTVKQPWFSEGVHWMRAHGLQEEVAMPERIGGPGLSFRFSLEKNWKKHFKGEQTNGGFPKCASPRAFNEKIHLPMMTGGTPMTQETNRNA